MEMNLPAVKVPQNTAFTYAPSALVVCSDDLTAKVVRYTPITTSAPTYRKKKMQMRATKVTNLTVVFCSNSIFGSSTASLSDFSFSAHLLLREPCVAMIKKPRLDANTIAPEIG